MPENIDAELADLRLQHEKTQTQLIQHQLDYTKRHGELSERVARIETLLPNLTTKDDLANMKNELISFWSKRLEEQTTLKADMDWLKRWFWALIGFCVGIGGAFISHLFGRL